MQHEVKFNHAGHAERRQGALMLALAGLQQQQLSPGHLSRVAVERDGTLHIEAETASSQRWFRYSTTLKELRPRDEKKIPLLQKLCENSEGPRTAVLSYRPGRRVVLGMAGMQHLSIVKGYKRRGSERAASCHEIAAAACGRGGFLVPRLLEHRAEDESLVMARHRGASPGIGYESVKVWAAIGTRLRSFQSACVTEPLQEFDAQDELAILDEQARRFLLCMPALPENWQMGRDLLTEAAARLSPAELCLTHRDLHDGQFLVCGEQVSLLDFDLLCKADTALDAGNLLAHIVLRELQSGSGDRRAADCRRALLSGLARQAEPGFGQRLLFYQATSFYRLALLYALRPRWAHLTKVLIEHGKRCIDAYKFKLS